MKYICQMKFSRLAICFFAILIHLPNLGISKDFSISILSQGAKNDSSFYSLCKVNDNEIWALGKNGVINSINLQSRQIRPVNYPNTGEFIYRAARFPDNRIIAVGESGLILIYNPISQLWSKKKLPNFENRCIYSILTINDSVAYATGGHNKIALSQGVIPHGFIIATYDGGETWKKIHYFPTSMVWNLAQSKENPEILYFSVYRPPFTRLITYNTRNLKISFSKVFTGLYHDLLINKNDQIVFCGSAGFKYSRNGRITLNGEATYKAGKNIGAFWKISYWNNLYLVTGCKGKIMLSRDLSQWSEIETPVELNYYAAIDCDSNNFIVAGQNQTLLWISKN